MAASHFHVDNLVLLVDNNDMQADGRTADIMAVEPVDRHLAAFGWWVRRVDGHDTPVLLEALRDATAVRGQPAALVCTTVPGKGCPTLEAYRRVHYIRAAPTVWEAALAELDAAASSVNRG